LFQKKARFITGAFDPLLVEQARALTELSGPNHLLIVIITNPANALLPQRARAELVAALAAVDYVVIGAELDAVESTRQFMEHVVCKSRVS
jgi:glycerol-3-phosphate cytidylyltransferase-like family protein